MDTKLFSNKLIAVSLVVAIVMIQYIQSRPPEFCVCHNHNHSACEKFGCSRYNNSDCNEHNILDDDNTTIAFGVDYYFIQITNGGCNCPGYTYNYNNTGDNAFLYFASGPVLYTYTTCQEFSGDSDLPFNCCLYCCGLNSSTTTTTSSTISKSNIKVNI